MKRIMLVIVVLALILGAYLIFGRAHTQRLSDAQLANPASMNCVQTLGGTLEIVDESGGQVGYCHLSDGRVCEEWELFRNGTCTQPSAPQETASSTPGAYEPGNLLLGTDGNTSGTYLIGSSGMPLYVFDKDANGTTTCYGACAATWPPYTIRDVASLMNVQSGVKGDVGFITRADDAKQVTYNGKPLYFYTLDAGTSTPQGVGVHGLWQLARP